jgi:predicted aspartyl protease
MWSNPCPPTTRRAILAIGLAAAFAPVARAQTARVAVEIDENGHVLAPVRINGESCLAQIDNGFASSALDLAFARQRKLVSGEQARVNGAPAALSTPLSLAFAGRRFDLRLRLVDLTVSAISGLTQSAIIGRDVLNAMGLTVDAKEGWIEARPLAPGADAPEGLAPVRVQRAGSGDLVTEIAVEGGRPLKAMIDLGCGVPLIVRKSAATRRWLADGRRSTGIVTYQALGERMVEHVNPLLTVSSLNIGGHTLSHVPAAIMPADLAPFGGFEATIGAAALNRFRLFLSTSEARLALAPGRGFADAFYKSLTGMSTVQDRDRVRVVNVWRSSPAEAAGVARGDAIVAINGGPARRTRLASLKAGDALVLELDDGSARRLSAAEFY